MTWFDYAVLAIVGISVLFSIMHGFVRELLALASWVVAFLVAQLFATEVAPILTGITNPSLRLLVAFLAVFVATFIAMTVLAILLSSMIKRAGLGAVDRLLGALFGLVRGRHDRVTPAAGLAACASKSSVGITGRHREGVASRRFIQAYTLRKSERLIICAAY